MATATILVVMLAMAASTLVSLEASTRGVTAAAGHTYVAQSHRPNQVKNSWIRAVRGFYSSQFKVSKPLQENRHERI